MRHFPFKTLILCILLPPFVYVFSIQLLERTIQAQYDEALAAMYTGDSRRLFDGSVRLQDAIRKNIDSFLSSRKLIDWGVRVNVTVKTRDGVYLYPFAYDDAKSDMNGPDSLVIARDNFQMLNDGLIRTVEVEIGHNKLISNVILLSCVGAALIMFVFIYRRGMEMTRKENLANQELIDGLTDERQQRLSQLERLESQRTQLSQKLETMKVELSRERHQVSATEDEMLEELVALEDKIGENLALRDRQLNEINALKEKIKEFEKEKEATTRQRLKGAATTRKRFEALYKNITIHNRALEGFVDLTEEMKIKAEEVVHQLNDDPKLVQIKRKVFGKKNRETVFEVIFAYKGRLYFRNVAGSRVEVLVIGTKLTQNKDLVFLDKL